jgi:transcriptional regulator of acetoin/glycerol metabolism
MGILIAAILRELFGETADSAQFDAEAARALWRYAWPGNIRELERCLQVAVVSAGGKSIALEHLPLALGEPQEDQATRRRSEDLERREKLVVLLRRHRGNVSAVARAYGRDRALVRRWLQRHGLDPSEFR